VKISLIVNGRTHEVDAPADERLLATLRDRLDLTGAKLVCGRGECGACTVLVDGRLAYSCLTLTAASDSAQITTIEGLGTADRLHPVQRAFADHDAAQCGYCTPGQVLAAVKLLAESPSPTEEQIVRGMSGNLCRCGTYPKIRAAIASLSESGR
jgi:aerobic-type carbon monoxide dehydrogenase small subunit (CoxS/CutS family)